MNSRRKAKGLAERQGESAMNSAEQVPGRTLLIIVLFVPALQGIAAPTVAAKCANVQILSDQLTASEAEAYCVYAVAERQKVEDFWGASWKSVSS
jgi:hypothetical protein